MKHDVVHGLHGAHVVRGHVEALLRDPNAVDWTLHPMESLSVLRTPHPASYEHWFLLALERNNHERALEIADLARRHRFHSTLEFGGRLLALR